jgi:hypothetical protein
MPGAVLHRHIARMRGGCGVELGIKDQCLQASCAPKAVYAI